MAKQVPKKKTGLRKELTDKEILKKKNLKKSHIPEKKKADFEAQIEAEKEKFIRLFAEFENYKKRTSRERLELFRTAGQEVITVILPVLDDFDRAINQLSKIDNSEFLEGVQIMKDKLFNALKSKGLEVIKTEKKEIFNVDIHEAITQIPAPELSLKGKVIEVVEQGYRLGDKILRYPKVIVGK